MAHQDTTPDKPSHTPGTNRGEELQARSAEAGREGPSANSRSSTSINPSAAGPIDPRMPNLPPA